jgi:transposase-like protein
MVEIKRVDGWKCPTCNKFYTNHSDAAKCIENCTAGLEDEPYEESRFSYTCEACKKTYLEEKEAFACENKHSKNKDRFQQAREDEDNRKRLLHAGNDKFQRKLF